jgi:hypothetical protein
MPLIEWAMTDNAAYAKHLEEVDAIILGALLDGPKRSYDLIDRLRLAGFGNARNDGPLELSYSMTGAIFRSAYNSLRSRGMVCDSYDKDGRNYARPSLIWSRAQLLASEGSRVETAHGDSTRSGPQQQQETAPPPPNLEAMA